MAANKSRHKDGITHLGLEHQPKEGNSLWADGKKHAPVTSFLRADGPGIASLLLALAPEGPGQAPGEMVFHRTHTHHEKMELIPRLGNPSPAVLWSSRVHSGPGPGSLERGAHPVKQGHGALAQVCGGWGSLWENQTRLLSSWLCRSFWNDTVIHQGEEVRWSFHLGAGANLYFPIGKGDK